MSSDVQTEEARCSVDTVPGGQVPPRSPDALQHFPPKWDTTQGKAGKENSELPEENLNGWSLP